MKRIIGLFLVAAIAGTSVKAQEIPERKTERPRMMHKGKHHRGGMNLEKLNLTEDQKAKFKSQRESFKKQMEELKKNDGITVKEWKSQMETLRKENKTKMDAILTTDQKAQLEKQRAEQKTKMQDFQKQHAQKMKERLNLTDEQSAKMDANRKEIGEKMKSIREDKSLSDEQKREKVKDVMKSNKEKMKSILTDEQMKKMNEMRHKRHDGERKHDGEKKKPETSKTI